MVHLAVSSLICTWLVEQLSQDGIKAVSGECGDSQLLLSMEMAVLGTGNLDCGKWLEAVLDIFLAVINLFGGLWMLFLLFTWGTSFQQSKMDGMASGFRRERFIKGWYSISSLLKCSEHTVVWSFTY